jgi:hypothetical protein
MFGHEEEIMATPMDAVREFARNYGYDHPDQAWVLHDFDVWERNPFYHGPPVPHPESIEAEMGLPAYEPPPVEVVEPQHNESCPEDDIPF